MLEAILTIISRLWFGPDPLKGEFSLGFRCLETSITFLKLEKSRQLYEAINRLSPENPAEYSNFTSEMLLPFPSLWEDDGTISEGFDLTPSYDSPTATPCFTYFGRATFAKLWKRVGEMSEPYPTSDSLHLSVTSGFGTSHILAALAVLLMHRKKRVVYLPDCPMMLRPGSSIRYIQQAVLHAFSGPGNSSAWNRISIKSCRNLEELGNFCHSLVYRRPVQRLYFVVDGFDAFDITSMDEYMDNSERKEVFFFLRRMTFDHIFVSSASASYDMPGVPEFDRSCYEMRFCGGLTTVSVI
jgi:hypothetical protein